MNLKKSVRAFLAAAARPAECREARAAWSKRTVAALADAQKAMDDICMEALDLLDEDEFEVLVQMEQRKVDKIMAQLRAAIHEDRWPRELYVGGL